MSALSVQTRLPVCERVVFGLQSYIELKKQCNETIFLILINVFNISDVFLLDWSQNENKNIDAINWFILYIPETIMLTQMHSKY